MNDLKKTIRSVFKNNESFTTKELLIAISNELPNLKESSLRWRINQLKTEGVIFQIGRGMYSLKEKRNYEPKLSLKTMRLGNRVNKLIPDIPLTIWDTYMLDEFDKSNQSHEYTFMYCKKDKIKRLFDEILDFSKVVFLNPSEEVIERYVSNHDYSIILLPIVSEAPLVDLADFTTVSLEMLLVDCFVLRENYIQSTKRSLSKIYKQSFKKYNVNRSKLMRYAARRDKRSEIEKLIASV